MTVCRCVRRPTQHASAFTGLAEVWPKARILSLGLVPPRPVDDPRIAKRIRISTDRVVHMMTLTAAEDVDDQIGDWLTEAYDAAGAPLS